MDLRGVGVCKLADFCASALCEVHKRFSIEGGEIHSVKEGIQILHGGYGHSP